MRPSGPHRQELSEAEDMRQVWHGGHIEKFCGQKQLTSKEKMLAKYSEVCHRWATRDTLPESVQGTPSAVACAGRITGRVNARRKTTPWRA